MRHLSIFKATTTLLVAFALFSMLLVQVGCRKTGNPSTDVPINFTELKINPSFQFENFINLDISIGVSNSGTQLLSVIQIYQGDPKVDGKLIATGATDVNSQYKTNLRVPSRLKELWVCKISVTGENEYIAVPITGTTMNYTFGKSGVKSSTGTESNDCNTGTPIVNSGSYTINSGQVSVVQPGVSVSNLQLTINQGGTVRICGSANITSLHGSGNLIVSPSGTVMIPVSDLDGSIENYGTANFAQAGNDKKFKIKSDGTIHNWGVLTMSNGLEVQGILINEYHMTVVEQVQTYEDGRIINYCQLFINSNSSEAFKLLSGSSSNPGFINHPNAYLKVTGKTIISGDAHISLGLQSLIETGSFDIQGNISGPATQGSQIHALGSSTSKIAAATLTGYIDFWATTISPKNGTFGPNITWHNPGYTVISQDCNAMVPPVITSSLTAAGIVGTAITPYIISATGTGPITFNATNLPAGLTYNAATYTISGTPTTVQSKSVTLTADNLVGTDSKTLVFTIIAPGSAPVITSTVTAHTPVNQSFTYTILATGTGTITFNASNLPANLTFNATTHEIGGIPTSSGVYNIPISATNIYGSNNKTLVLTVGNPPSISSALTATGTTGQQFITYTVTASGSGPITYNATNLPSGLNFSEETHTINGTPLQATVTNVTLTATNEYGNDSKVLVITINEPVTAPLVTSPLTAAGTKNQPFSYAITASGTQPVVCTATNLPAGLVFDPQFFVISGIPSSTGTTNVTLTATNSAGSDTKTLVLNIFAPAIIDTDGDGVADALDAYPNDATRAFNSFYPNEIDFGSYAFEDLWPSYGDYDFNDLVMNFNYKIVTNAQNKVVDLIAKFKVKASGASHNNGFGVAFSTAPSNVESVTGCIKVGSVVNIDPKGYEEGHTTNTVIIPVDAVNTLLGTSIVNTVHGGHTVQTEVETVVIHLSTPQTTIGTPPYNAFIFINKDRGKEVHLKDQAPTQLANPVYFGSMNDASNPGLGYYYRSSSGLPWGLEIPVDFDYPVEKIDILQTYLHFAEWAQSSGTTYPDWYMDKPGYRNVINIY